MGRYKIGIVIPALNEAETITEVVIRSAKYGLPIVVDDGSTDDTAIKASAAGAEVVVHTKNSGYEQALNTGFEKALELQCNYVITLDADGQHAPELIGRIIEKISQGADVVLGVRHQLPRVSEVIFAFYTKLKFNIKDPCCGLKAYSINVYKALGTFDQHKSIGTELSIYAVKNGYTIKEVDFKVIDRSDKPRYGSIVRANIKIFKALVRTIRKNLF